MPVAVVALLALFCLARSLPLSTALPATSDRVSEHALGAQCDCSPSGRAFDPAVRVLLLAELEKIGKLQAERQLGASYTSLKECYKRYNMDACMNADKSLRTSPSAITYCIYDLKTGVNLAEEQSGNFDFRPLDVCKPPPTDSTAQTNTPAKPTVTPKPGDEEKAAVEKKPMPVQKPPPPPAEESPKPPTEKSPPVSEEPKSVPEEPKPATEKQKPTPEQPKPAQSKEATAAPSKAAKKPTEAGQAADDSQQVWESTGDNKKPAPASKPSAQPAPAAAKKPAPTPAATSAPLDSAQSRGTNSVNEGCVAVEHLHGHVLQHRRHLRRPVLCARNFCATPNHAIIVGGRLTSMRRLCNSGWKCVPAVKLVNNLKIAYNTHARVSEEIVVTAYDIRFPKLLSWIAQIAEDCLDVVARSALVGAVAACAVVASAVVTSKNSQ